MWWYILFPKIVNVLTLSLLHSSRICELVTCGTSSYVTRWIRQHGIITTVIAVMTFAFNNVGVIILIRMKCLVLFVYCSYDIERETTFHWIYISTSNMCAYQDLSEFSKTSLKLSMISVKELSQMSTLSVVKDTHDFRMFTCVYDSLFVVKFIWNHKWSLPFY